MFTSSLNQGWPDDWSACFNIIRVASVAGEAVNQQLVDGFAGTANPAPVFARTQARAAGVTNSYQEPARMGVDRWLVMLAAYSKARGRCCVVDCGSAITVDYIEADGRHQGGYIIPGLRLMQRGLLANTAEIIVDQDPEAFTIEPGQHTSAAVVHGINYAFQALAEKIVAELGETDRLYVTGGDGALFQHLCGRGEFVPELVLDGLVLGVQG